MEYKGKQTLKFKHIFFFVSFLFILGIVGDVELGAPVAKMWWAVLTLFINGIIVIIDNL